MRPRARSISLAAKQSGARRCRSWTTIECFSRPIVTMGPLGSMLKPSKKLIKTSLVSFQLSGAPYYGEAPCFFEGSNRSHPQRQIPSPPLGPGSQSPPKELGTGHAVRANFVDPPLVILICATWNRQSLGRTLTRLRALVTCAFKSMNASLGSGAFHPWASPPMAGVSAGAVVARSPWMACTQSRTAGAVIFCFV